MTEPETSPTVPALPSRRPRKYVVLIAVLAVLAGAGVAVAGLYGAGAFSTEIVAEPLIADGENPFMPAIGAGKQVARPARKTGVTVTGETSGLYGGTLNNAACDPAKMVTFLQQNPDKAAAWSGVLGIDPATIPGYVAELTPLILRSDTAVTNHGFANGKATTVNSVLEAGTAVLVDRFGVPRVRCKCGNPLTPAKTFSRPAYEGMKWAEFDPQQITNVQPAPQVINTFVIINLTNNESTINRPAGSLGERDEGLLEDATFARNYTMTRTDQQCGGAERCQQAPIPLEITCVSDSECTIRRLDGRWLNAHALLRTGGTWRAAGPDAGAYDCNFVPQPGTLITFEITPVTAASVDGVWQIEKMRAVYTIDGSGAPACEGERLDDAVFQLAN